MTEEIIKKLIEMGLSNMEGRVYIELLSKDSAGGYQIAKEIGAMATVLKGKVDAILLTGGIAYGKPVTDYIADMVSFIAPVKVYPGEDEMRALAMNGLMVLRGEMQAKAY